jgi:hypothetical protein
MQNDRSCDRRIERFDARLAITARDQKGGIVTRSDTTAPTSEEIPLPSLPITRIAFSGGDHDERGVPFDVRSDDAGTAAVAVASRSARSSA